MNQTGPFWSLYRRYHARAALRSQRSARRAVLLGAAVGSLAFFLIFQSLGLRAAVATIGWATVVLSPVAGLDAWCGTMLNGHPAVAWARLAFWVTFSLAGLYLALNAGTVAGLLER